MLPPPVRALLAAELATASLAHRDGDGGARILARRFAAQVCVHGGGRVGTDIASLLTTSGIGRVMRADSATEAAAQPPGAARPSTKPPGAQRSGTPASEARPSTNPPGQLRPGPPRPDLAVLVGRQPLELRASLMREQIPHLAAAGDEAIGIVGPLVIPGRTACLRCMDLARTDRDPAWPLILAQLAGREPDPLACDAPLAAAVAAHAAAQALAFIDRPFESGAVENGTLELVLPSWQWRRRTWPPHPDCDCGSR